jgi:hypothetical protein
MARTAQTEARYGALKDFQTEAGIVRAATRQEAEQKVKGRARGPNFTPSLQGEPAGNRKHSDVTYLGNRDAVRRLNRDVG